jgi:hypothetical protein
MTRLGILIATVSALSVAGCGIQPESEPREVQPPPGPYSVLTEPGPGTTEAGAVRVHLVMTRDGALTVVTRLARSTPSLDGLMEDLLAGPTETEQADGIGSALTGADLIGDVHPRGVDAEVELATGLDGTGRSDVVLAIAQVVCTLVARPEVEGVVFIRSGELVAVPQGDGALSKGPLTFPDYACPPIPD